MSETGGHGGHGGSGMESDAFEKGMEALEEGVRVADGQAVVDAWFDAIPGFRAATKPAGKKSGGGHH